MAIWCNVPKDKIVPKGLNDTIHFMVDWVQVGLAERLQGKVGFSINKGNETGKESGKPNETRKRDRLG